MDAAAIWNNLKILLWPALICWLMFFIAWLRGPYRFRNCCLLLAALFFTAPVVAGLFGEHMPQALVGIFLVALTAVFFVPVLLIINGVTMLKREGRSLAHLLSLFVGLLIGLGEIAAFAALLLTTEEALASNLVVQAVWFFAASAIYFCLLMLAFVLYMLILQVMPHRNRFDYIIIHGSGLVDGNRVPRLLANRLDRAIAIYKRSRVKPTLIPSGGKGTDETVAEADAMGEYLLQHGVAAEHILRENRSATTMENLQNSQALINARGGGKKIALVSSNYHVYRCLSYAAKLQLKCTGIGAKVARYYWPSAVIREFVAVFRQRYYLIRAAAGYVLLVVLPVFSLLLSEF